MPVGQEKVPWGAADEAAPPRRGQRYKSPAELDFYGEFDAALCGAPVLPVLPKAKCGRRKRAKRAKGTPSACLLFDSFRTSVFCEVRTQIVGKTKFFDSLEKYVCPKERNMIY